MKAGSLKHRITIQRPVKERDTDGAEIVIWSDLATVWAAVEPQNGSERHIQDSDQLLASRLTKFTIRAHNGLDATMRIIFGSQVFDIQQIINVATGNREMWLMGKENGV